MGPSCTQDFSERRLTVPSPGPWLMRRGAGGTFLLPKCCRS